MLNLSTLNNSYLLPNTCLLFWFQCRKRQLKVAVVGVPKTIDNDILLMDKTFGFDTAVEEAQRAINSAYIEVRRHCLHSLTYTQSIIPCPLVKN